MKPTIKIITASKKQSSGFAAPPPMERKPPSFLASECAPLLRKNVAGHELGHVLGWDGHVFNSTAPLMHVSTNNSTNNTVTRIDKLQIRQFYDLFY